MIQIGGNYVGETSAPYFIAEIGSNWKSFEDAYNSIEAAKNAGAQAVKFQFFDFKSLYGISKPKKSVYDDSCEMLIDWIPKLKQRSDQMGINFMCTVFNPDHVKAINPHVYAHKIASSDITHVSLLQEINRMGKPVFLSTGAASIKEIELAKSYLSNVPVILMYCVSAYPAKSVDLTLIDALRAYSSYVGFSDHTTDAVYIPFAAVKYHKAVAIEKHMTIIDLATPDSPHSVSASRFKLMVDRISGKAHGMLGATEEEADMTLRHQRRLIVTEEVKKGDKLKFNKNFGAYRSLKVDTKAASPFAWKHIDGKVSKKDFEPGDPVTDSDYE